MLPSLARLSLGGPRVRTGLPGVAEGETVPDGRMEEIADDEDCPICVMPIKEEQVKGEGNPVAYCKGGHLMHPSCRQKVLGWRDEGVHRSQNCPVCKTPVANQQPDGQQADDDEDEAPGGSDSDDITPNISVTFSTYTVDRVPLDLGPGWDTTRNVVLVRIVCEGRPLVRGIMDSIRANTADLLRIQEARDNGGLVEIVLDQGSGNARTYHTNRGPEHGQHPFIGNVEDLMNRLDTVLRANYMRLPIETWAAFPNQGDGHRNTNLAFRVLYSGTHSIFPEPLVGETITFDFAIQGYDRLNTLAELVRLENTPAYNSYNPDAQDPGYPIRNLVGEWVEELFSQSMYAVNFNLRQFRRVDYQSGSQLFPASREAGGGRTLRRQDQPTDIYNVLVEWNWSDEDLVDAEDHPLVRFEPDPEPLRVDNMMSVSVAGITQHYGRLRWDSTDPSGATNALRIEVQCSGNGLVYHLLDRFATREQLHVIENDFDSISDSGGEIDQYFIVERTVILGQAGEVETGDTLLMRTLEQHVQSMNDGIERDYAMLTGRRLAAVVAAVAAEAALNPSTRLRLRIWYRYWEEEGEKLVVEFTLYNYPLLHMVAETLQSQMPPNLTEDTSIPDTETIPVVGHIFQFLRFFFSRNGWRWTPPVLSGYVPDSRMPGLIDTRVTGSSEVNFDLDARVRNLEGYDDGRRVW